MLTAWLLPLVVVFSSASPPRSAPDRAAPEQGAPGQVTTGEAAKRRTLQWWAETELGVELDTNATRLDSAATSGKPVTSALLRGHTQLGLRWRPLGTFAAGMSYDLAGKVFFRDEARDQDTLIHRGNATVGFRLAEGLLAQVAGLYHEGFQRNASGEGAGASLFDFRLLDGRAQIVLVPHTHLVASLGLGVQRYTYKPSDAISFDSVLGALTLESGWTLGKGARESELELSFDYSVAHRRYGAFLELLCTTLECREQCEADPSCDPSSALTYTYRAAYRADLAQRLGLGVTWVGPVLLSARYVLVTSRSNSFGLGYVLHDVTGKLVAPLVWRIYGTLQFRARILSAAVPGAIEERGLGFEEENRSHALVQLERSLWKQLKVILRYTLFVGDLKAPEPESLRHLVFLGLSYRR